MVLEPRLTFELGRPTPNKVISDTQERIGFPASGYSRILKEEKRL
jgi:hypothetical protein